MSMMRASGAMPTITALQMATASLATPKSLMKTMVGCGMACPGTGSALLSVRNFEQAPARKTNASKDKATLDIILGILGGVVGGWVFGMLGLHAGGLIGSIIVSFVGAVILVWITRLLKKK